MRLSSSLLVAVAAVLLLEPVAHACSGSCSAVNTVPNDDGTVMPVNAAGILWSGIGVEQVVLRDVEADLILPIAFEGTGALYELRPADPLEVGRTYRFELPYDGCDGPFTRTFSTGPAVELASTNLGTLIADPPEQTHVEIAESVVCSIQVPAVSVDIRIGLDPQLDAFAPLLVYQTLVDGEPWGHIPHDFAPFRIGESWRGRGVDRVFATCPGPTWDGTGTGTHQVQMRATIPGLPGITLESDIVEINLECAPDEEDDEGDEDDDSGDTGSFIAPYDPALDDTRGGCGCSSDGGRSGAMFGAPLLLLLALARRRR